MTYTITKDYALSYSHTLDGLPAGHQCARMHGHNAVVRVELAAVELDEHGFVVDYGDLTPLGKWLDEMFDHRHLNDVVGWQPTAENLARHVYEHTVDTWGWPVVSVGWSETPKTWAYWHADGLP